jgi:hypothetical protein
MDAVPRLRVFFEVPTKINRRPHIVRSPIGGGAILPIGGDH